MAGSGCKDYIETGACRAARDSARVSTAPRVAARNSQSLCRSNAKYSSRWFRGVDDDASTEHAARAFGIFASGVPCEVQNQHIQDPKEITVLLISLAIRLATGVR